MSRLSFFWRVFGGTVAVILITAFVLYLSTVSALREHHTAVTEERVHHETSLVASLCALAYSPAAGAFDTAPLAEVAARTTGIRITLIGADGRVVFDSHQDPAQMDDHGNRPEVLHPGKAITRFSRTLSEEMTYCALPVEAAGELRGHARVALAVEDLETQVAALGAAVRSATLLAGAISLILALAFARRVTRPLHEIATVVGDIGRGQTSRRLHVGGDDEFGDLAAAVNQMAEDLEAKIERVERDRAEREALMSAMIHGLLAVDTEARVLFINPPARELLGGIEGPLKGKPVCDLSRNNDLAQVLERCLASDERAFAETIFASDEGARTVELAAVPLAGTGQERRGCVLELRDVTELRRLEAVRRDFVSNVSHELKTPLTAMRGFVEVLLDDPEMSLEQRRDFLEKANKNTERLSAIVTDLLSLSRLESQDREQAIDTIELVELTEEVLQHFRDPADARQIELCLRQADEPLVVQADGEALGMALSNVVDNAIQYSPPGTRVVVTLSREEGEARIAVSDSGPGIAPAEQERIFERFYRVDKARSRDLGGTGLGLSIVRHVMVAHGGRVELESVPGEGATFGLVIPLRA